MTQIEIFRDEKIGKTLGRGRNSLNKWKVNVEEGEEEVGDDAVR
jgi:hypothetical protein